MGRQIVKKNKQRQTARDKFPALAALRRAAKKAIEVARQTGTAAYVLENGKIVNAARPRRRSRKTGSGKG